MAWWHEVGRYWRTLRHLRPVQIYGRVWFRLWRPNPDLRTSPPRANPSGPWCMPAIRLPSMSGPRSWVFLNEAGHLDELGWDGPQREKLWRYNQHYFDDLNALDAPDRLLWHKAVVSDWVAHNPPGVGTGWEPYPLSLRVVNWIKWALSGAELSEAAEQSLAVQIRWLSGRIENHLLGNHLFANAKALVFAGLYFEGPEAECWLSTGFRILSREIPEQILADGGHFERSTMYHALAYEDMLDLINVTSAFPNASRPWAHLLESWPHIVKNMGYWLRSMCHLDGEIGLFNDAAFGIAPAPRELFAYAARLDCDRPDVHSDVVYLESSGYIRVSVGGAVLLIDVAPVGPDYLPGHAHADTLSFEFSLNGQRIIVNGGTSLYGIGPQRQRERGTAAHSTVEINRQDSSEVWSCFRVARRAYPFDVSVKRDGATVIVDAAHDGYKRFAGQPVHRRRWILGDGRLQVIDHIEGRFNEAVSRVHFHPDVLINAAGPAATVSWAGRSAALETNIDQVNVATSEWHPRFGVSLDATCLELTINPAVAAQPACWFALDWH